MTREEKIQVKDLVKKYPLIDVMNEMEESIKLLIQAYKGENPRLVHCFEQDLKNIHIAISNLKNR